MLKPNSPYWNSVVLKLLTRVAPPVVAATVLLTAAPGNSPAQSGWKWKKPHAHSATETALPPKNGFATSITRLMDQARSAAQQGDFETALQAATRAEKLADAAEGVLGPHADCSPEAARQLVQDLRVLQAANPASPPSAGNSTVLATPAQSSPPRPNFTPTPVATAAKPQQPTPQRYPQPPVIARQEVAKAAVAAAAPAKPAIKPYVPVPLTPPPVAAVASRPFVSAGAPPVIEAPVVVRPRYDTVVTADLSVQSAPVTAQSSPGSFLALGEFAIVDSGEAANVSDAVATAPALPDEATAHAQHATAPEFPEEPTPTTVAASPYINTFPMESLSLVDESSPAPVAAPYEDVQLVADEPVGLTFLMETETADAQPATEQVLATGRSHAAASSSSETVTEEAFMLPQPLVTEVLPIVSSPQAPDQTLELPTPPTAVATQSKPPEAGNAEQNVVIDASLMEWSSATGRKQPISRTRHLELNSAWEPARSNAQPVKSETEPEFQTPVSDQPSAQYSRGTSNVITAVEQSPGGSTYVEAASLVTTQPATLPQVVSRLSPGPTDRIESSTDLVAPLPEVVSTGPATWLRTAHIEPTDESFTATKTQPAVGPARWIDQLATTWNVSPRIVGLLFGGCGLLLLGSGSLLFRGSRSQPKV